MQQNRQREAGELKTKREIGSFYEQKAAEYLQKKGYRILKQNFYSRFGEIDLIARDGGYLVFVEVRYRTNGRGGHPLETVDIKKQGRIRRSAQFYLLRHGFSENTPCRFDMVGILGEEIIHLENAFS